MCSLVKIQKEVFRKLNLVVSLSLKMVFLAGENYKKDFHQFGNR